MPFDERGDLVAVALRHADVGEHDVGPVRLHALDGLPAVTDRDDRMSSSANVSSMTR